ncbi:uncharacterized protein [Argopecten irradians]|uniref:uncharacterized protein n=1 Tax=Argopecten irradians TaxID=31199 RepID=UPI0037239C99
MKLKPSEIRFCQDSINFVFDKKSSHSGKRIGETLDALLRGQCTVSQIPTITVVQRNGVWYTADNRRLWVFRKLEELGKCTTIPVYQGYSIPSKKFTTTNNGISVTVRGKAGGSFWRTCKRVPIVIAHTGSENNRTMEKDEVTIKTLDYGETATTTGIYIPLISRKRRMKELHIEMKRNEEFKKTLGRFIAIEGYITQIRRGLKQPLTEPQSSKLVAALFSKLEELRKHTTLSNRQTYGVPDGHIITEGSIVLLTDFIEWFWKIYRHTYSEACDKKSGVKMRRKNRRLCTKPSTMTVGYTPFLQPKDIRFVDSYFDGVFNRTSKHGVTKIGKTLSLSRRKIDYASLLALAIKRRKNKKQTNTL